MSTSAAAGSIVLDAVFAGRMLRNCDRGAVSVVQVLLDGAAFDASVLDTSERARARRFVRAKDRRRFLAAHVATRWLLAECTSVHPRALRFTSGAHGKPRLADAPCDVRFNLSHAGAYACVAIAVGREIGVDIERYGDVDVDGLVDLVCSPRERDVLARAAPDVRRQWFYRCWTRKESFIKAIGHGLLFPLQTCDVNIEGLRAELVASGEHEPTRPRRWTITSLDAGPGYAAAITVEGSDCRIVCSAAC